MPGCRGCCFDLKRYKHALLGGSELREGISERIKAKIDFVGKQPDSLPRHLLSAIAFARRALRIRCFSSLFRERGQKLTTQSKLR